MKAIDVARVLAWAAESEPEEDRLTHMRLQKLLYYVQAWSLVERGEPMFPERIEAWIHGPVVRELFFQLRRFGANAIDPRELGEFDETPSADDERFVRSVWEAYRDYSTNSLRDMSHAETPWKDARRGLDSAVQSDREISHQSLRDYFSAVA